MALTEPYRRGPQAVTYLDARGAIVSAPLPAGLEPVDDAAEPCPACGEVQWGRVETTAVPPLRPPHLRLVDQRADAGLGVASIATFYGPGIGEPVPAAEVERMRARQLL